jgi:hypothetical protein
MLGEPTVRYREGMLDPGKHRQRAHVSAAIEEFRCVHGEPVSLNWHPHRADGWFDIEAHCDQGVAEGTRRAAEALARFPAIGAP